MASIWTMALIKDGFHDLPSTYRSYAILENGIVIGKLKYDRGRWKSAGGPAWQGTINEGGAIACYYNKNRDKVLHWFKTREML